MTDTAMASAAPKAKVRSGYHVLRQQKDPVNGWLGVSIVDAKSANEAIRAVVAKLAETEQSGTFLAIPVRSWHPVTVTPKVTTSLDIKEAT